jgi:hypothetical protein
MAYVDDTSGSSAVGGLLSGFANSYMQTKKLQNEQALQQGYLGIAQKNSQMQQQNEQAGLLAKGMQTDDSGNVSYTPEQQQIVNTQKAHSLNEANLQTQFDTPGSEANKNFESIIRPTLESAYGKKYSDQMYPQGITASEFEQSNVGPILKYKIDLAKQQAALALQNTRMGITQSDKLDKRFTDLSNTLDANKGRAGNLASLQDRLNKADRIDQLVQKSNENPHGLTGPEMQELATSTASLLKGSGNVSEGEINGLMPKTAKAKYGSLMEYLSNEPQALNNQAFVNNYKNLVDRERTVTGQQLKTAQYQKLGGFSDLRNKDKDRFEAILQDHGLSSDEYDQFQKSGSKGLLGRGSSSGGSIGTQSNNHPQDSQAVQWAQAHPGDPRAAKILNVNGLTNASK